VGRRRAPHRIGVRRNRRRLQQHVVPVLRAARALVQVAEGREPTDLVAARVARKRWATWLRLRREGAHEPPPLLVRTFAMVSKAVAWVCKEFPVPPPDHIAVIALCGKQSDLTEQAGQQSGQ
jgi:hypothetical protein